MVDHHVRVFDILGNSRKIQNSHMGVVCHNTRGKSFYKISLQVRMDLKKYRNKAEVKNARLLPDIYIFFADVV